MTEGRDFSLERSLMTERPFLARHEEMRITTELFIVPCCCDAAQGFNIYIFHQIVLGLPCA